MTHAEQTQQINERPSNAWQTCWHWSESERVELVLMFLHARKLTHDKRRKCGCCVSFYFFRCRLKSNTNFVQQGFQWGFAIGMPIRTVISRRSLMMLRIDAENDSWPTLDEHWNNCRTIPSSIVQNNHPKYLLVGPSLAHTLKVAMITERKKNEEHILCWGRYVQTATLDLKDLADSDRCTWVGSLVVRLLPHHHPARHHYSQRLILCISPQSCATDHVQSTHTHTQHTWTSFTHKSFLPRL